MKALGALLLCVGIVLGIYALNMDVSVSVAAKDYGYGITSPAMQVANIDLMSQRQNLIIFAGILSVVGAVLFGFGAMQEAARPAPPGLVPAPAAVVEPTELVSHPPHPAPEPQAQNRTLQTMRAAPQVSVSICPSCRFMGGGDDTTCGRCGERLGA